MLKNESRHEKSEIKRKKCFIEAIKKRKIVLMVKPCLLFRASPDFQNSFVQNQTKQPRPSHIVMACMKANSFKIQTQLIRYKEFTTLVLGPEST